MPGPRQAAEDDARIVERWRRHGLYHCHPDLHRPIHSCVIPAPNATGELHMGHALNLSVQDVLCRWHRLEGCEVLWAGALDHGSFSTQTVVENELRRQGIAPRERGDEALRRDVEVWIAKISPRIFEQMEEFAVVLDLQAKETMADARSDHLISEYFVELSEKELAYLDTAVTEWCPSCQVPIDKVDQTPIMGEEIAYTIEYSAVDEPDVRIHVTTTTPETIHVDVALLDAETKEGGHDRSGRRFTCGRGPELELVRADAPLPMTWPRRVLRVTPGHCIVSHQLAKRHRLPIEVGYDAEGIMTQGPHRGLHREEARARVVEALRRDDRIVGTEPRTVRAPSCRNCKSRIEPYLSRQWFVRTRPMIEPTLALLRSEELRIHPLRYHQLCMTWLEQTLAAFEARSYDELTSDWCVSRSIQCGNRLPVHECACRVRVQQEAELEPCPDCGVTPTRSFDVLDMRVADSLWAYCANRRYTSDREVLRRIGRSATCVTGLDLLFYWIMPIAMLSTVLDDPLPFRDVVVHPMICDEAGRKMSKSLGNVVVPTEIVGRRGADCLRLALLDGLDLEASRLDFSDELLERNEVLLGRLVAVAEDMLQAEGDAEPVERMSEALEEIRAAVKAFDLGALHRHVVGVVDSLEEARQGSAPRATATLALKILHPFAPITTERLWMSAYPDRGPLAAQAEFSPVYRHGDD